MKKTLPENVLDKIKHVANSAQMPLFVYGAGLHASEIESYFKYHGLPLDGFFVGDKYIGNKHQVEGRVFTISEVCKTHPNFHTIIGFCKNPELVELELSSQGIGGIGSRFAIDCRFWKEFQILDASFLGSRKQDLDEVRNLFSDELSQETFDEILATKVTRNPSRLNKLIRNPQYFPTDMPMFAPKAKDVVVDAGAFTGDTVEEFRLMVPNGRCAAYHAFEADPDNAATLGEYVKSRELNFVKTYSVALGDREGMISFDAAATTSSKIISGSGRQIPMATLDSFQLSPSLIKMDIEGAEPLALRGAAKTIAAFRPRLAVTIYHSFSDFIEIPKIVNSLCPEYKMHLRIHRPYTEEIVLYATL